MQWEGLRAELQQPELNISVHVVYSVVIPTLRLSDKPSSRPNVESISTTPRLSLLVPYLEARDVTAGLEVFL